MEDYVIINGKKINYILSSSPNDNNIADYSTFLQSNNVKYLVNLGEREYNIDFLERKGITYKKYNYADGKVPDDDLKQEWLKICSDCIDNSKNLAVHCVSGMGRAPTMICISLILNDNYVPVEAIEYIRKKRKGSLNNHQLKYLFSISKKNNNNCIIT